MRAENYNDLRLLAQLMIEGRITVDQYFDWTKHWDTGGKKKRGWLHRDC